MTRGPQTSEFWLVVAGGVMLLINGTEFVNVPWDNLTFYLGVIGVYTGGRSFVKKGAGQVLAPPGPVMPPTNTPDMASAGHRPNAGGS